MSFDDLNELEGKVKIQIKTDLCDVTLSCEDKQMKIHRLIISSYSYALVPYVKNHSLYINRVA